MARAVLRADQLADFNDPGALIGQLFHPRDLAAAIKNHAAGCGLGGLGYRAVLRA